MVRRLATITIRLFPVLLCAALMAGCGGDASSGVGVPPPPPPAGPVVNGTVRLPNGRLALNRSIMERFAALVVEEAEALTASNVRPVGRNVGVQLSLRRSDGAVQTFDTSFTNDQGQFLIDLPSGTSEDTCRFMLSVGSGQTLTRAFVYSTTDPIIVDFASETAVALILGQVQQGADLCEFSTGEIRTLVGSIRALPGDVTGADVFETNRNALLAAAGDPDIQDELARFGNAPTPVPTITPQPPTATVPPTDTPTITVTPTVTLTRTRVPSPTATIPPSASPTRTKTVAPSATSTRTVTQTATKPPPSATSTQTPTVPNTATPTSTPLPTSTSTPTTQPTPTTTSTPSATPPQITIGSANGQPGAQVTVAISLTKNDTTIVTIAPLVIDTDLAVLTFGSCVSKVSGKNVDTGLPPSNPGRISITMSGSPSAVIPDGEIIDCTFTINAGASLNTSTPLTFVRAGMADADLNDIEGAGTSGAVTVGAVEPTNTPTVTPVVGVVPKISIGSASGAAGAQVTVPIALTSNGLNIVTIAPLVLTFDTNVLSFGTCTKTAAVSAGKSVNTGMPSAGQVTIALSGDLVALPDGDILNCTFTIAAGAAAGNTPLTFVSAGLSDDQFNDYDAMGTNGSVTIGATAGPQITIGSATGPAGTQVTVPISLTKNGPSIVTIAPLVLTFDTGVLSFGSCAKTAAVSAGKAVNTGTPSAGQITIALSGDLVVLPDGVIVTCTFTIAGGAPDGASPLTFVSAGLSDDQFNDYDATGTNGSVTVGAVTQPTATATPTQGVAGPQISIGSATGPAGTQVTVPISLTKNGPSIVTIAPLVLTFDTSVLSFGSCAKTAAVSAGKAVNTGTPSAGQITIALSGDLVVLPDGAIVTCTFNIAGGAPDGATPLTFVSAGLSDDQFNDYDATGTNGSVTVGTSTPPTATATPTQGVAGPQISIGSATGPAGTQVTVPISLTKNGPSIVTIAPLVLTFDTGVLSFGSCAKTAAVSAGKAVNTGTPSAGQITIALSGDLVVLPDGAIVTCTFNIAGGAPDGATPLTFVSAGLSDDQFNDFDATGNNGSVTVGVNTPPTVTPTPVPGVPAAARLASGIGASDTTIPLDDISQFPQSGTVLLGQELISYSGKQAQSSLGRGVAQAGSLLNVQRGVNGTTPEAHSPNDLVALIPSGASINVGSANGNPGGMVSIGVALVNDGASIAAASTDIVYDSTQVQVALQGTDPDCTINPALGAGTAPNKTLAISQPSSPVDMKVLRVAVLATGNVSLIPDGVLFTCKFEIAAGASAGVVNLLNAPSASDANSAAVAVVGTNGSITVTQAAPTPTPSPTQAALTPTPTQGATGPQISIGSTGGAAGAQVTVPISLTKNGPNIVTIAPLVVTFDTGVLSFGSCAKTAAVSSGKAVNTGMPSAGQITIALSGDLVVLPDGVITTCTFTIAAGAANGTSALTFVSAGLSDDQFNDYDATGTNGSVTVGQ